MGNVTAAKNSKILVGLSGGVDSSVVAALLQERGYKVEGAYMRCWSEGPYCTADKDEADATRVATKLDIPFQVINFEKEYKKKVIDYFYAEYEAGRTPNPDVMCNKEIKFGLFLNHARKRGFDYIATGHYVRVTNGSGYDLRTGIDESKDQSYFLYLVGQDQLAHALFPLGDLKKTQVRKLAKQYGLPTAEKPDSMGICFVGPVDIRELLTQKIKPKRGDVVSVDGKVMGEHIGLAFYTIGQREGLGVSARVPYYVVSKKAKKNELIVAPFGHASLFKDKFSARYTHWVAGVEPKFPKEVAVKLRYRAPNVAGIVRKLGGNRVEVKLNKAQRAITPGQSAVFYDGDKVIGGAVVESTM